MKDNLQMRQISIEFPGVKALDDVNLDIKPGEIRALVGANGAGKSTLMKVLGGVYTHYSGEVLLNDEMVRLSNPQDAKKNGIVVVYQEVDTALVANLSVAENIMMDMIISKEQSTFIDWKSINKEARLVIQQLGLDIDVNRKVNSLTLSEKQMVLIGRAVFHKAKYLILDEPTAPLSIEETKRLFKIVKTLKANNVAVIFISHRLDEVFEIAESITVLKDGKKVGDYPIEQMDINKVVEKMLGKKLEQQLPKHHVHIGDVQLKVENLSDYGMVQDVNFEVKSGEIVGISGLVGAGKTELCRLLFGASERKNGTILLNGNNITPKNSSQAVSRGMALVPEERRKEGILVFEDVETNITLPTLNNYTKLGFMNKGQMKKVAQGLIQRVGIKTPSEKQKVANLSGGNQQKVAIGKWIVSDADIYIFDEPTKGVDVGSKADIYNLIGELAEKGKSVIYASCEFDEILGLSDRTYVMYNGSIRKELITSETNEEELLYYSTGGGQA